MLYKEAFPADGLKDYQVTIFMILSLINFCLETTLGAVFCALWKKFSSMLKAPEYGVSKRQHIVINIAVSLIIILYFMAAVIFELLDSIMTARSIKDKSTIDWNDIFTNFYFLRFALDFCICMVILYLMHSFGPAA